MNGAEGMKNGKWVEATGTTIFVVVVLTREVVKPLDWKSLLILFGFFLVWGIIISASLATFFDDREINFFGFKISEKKNISDETKKEIIQQVNSELQPIVSRPDRRIAKLETTVKQLKDQINSSNKTLVKLSKEVSSKPDITIKKLTVSELLEGFYFTNNLEDFTKERQPIDLDGFYNTIQTAKKNDEAFKEDNYYRLIVKKYSEALAYKTIANIKAVCDARTLQDLEKLLYKAVEYPYSKDTIISIRDNLSNNSNKAKLTYEFERLIRNLDKLY